MTLEEILIQIDKDIKYHVEQVTKARAEHDREITCHHQGAVCALHSLERKIREE